MLTAQPFGRTLPPPPTSHQTEPTPTLILQTQHAASTIDQPNGQICEYCDSTSAMGGVTGPRCYGGAHNWQLGWFEGLDEFPRTRLSATEAVAVDLPRQGRGPSAVRVW